MIIKNLKIQNDEFRIKVAKKYLEENKNKETIISELPEYQKSKILTYISHLNRRLASIGIKVESENQENTQNNTEKSLIIKVYPKNKKLFLFIQTSKKFEDYLKSKKELRDTSNLLNRRNPGKFYHGNLIATNELDDINKEVVLLNSLNYGILRIQGISEGLELEISNLITEDRLIQLLEDFAIRFDRFYSEKILKNKLSIELNIEEPKNENQE